MAQPLMLESLEIQRFRAFEHMQIERLGRVNLITGKNNVGKSCLLEALLVYAYRGSPSQILQLMEARDEIQYPSRYYGPRVEENDLDQQALNIRHLFYGRSDIQDLPSLIKIGPVGRPNESLSIRAGWFTPSETKEAGIQQTRLPLDSKYAMENQVLVLVIQRGTQEPEIYSVAQYVEHRGPLPPEKKGAIPCIFIRANGLAPRQVALLWDTIALTDLEREVLTALRIIAPEVDGVTLVGEPDVRRVRTPIVRTPAFNVPVPLRSMGEGMNRILGIALALVNAKDGILLIDEFESGLHYSVQADLWRLVFQVAYQLNVQVFATTHSWDCVAAFQQAVQEDSLGGGLLISLRDKEDEPGHKVAVSFDKSELAIITRENIEVR